MTLQGKTISGYPLQRQLGIGGMAEVWYAENKIGKKAAVNLHLKMEESYISLSSVTRVKHKAPKK